MKIKERLLECKVKLGIKSDYALAKVLGINRGTLSGYMKGGRLPDAFTAVRIGEILNVHPLILLAEFEAENAKTEEQRGFWLNFGRRIKSGALGMLALTFTAFWWTEAKTGTTALDTHNG